MGRTHVTPFLCRLALVSVLFLALAGQASAASCWKRLMTDWYDGSIERTYPLPCYNRALARLKPDLRLYSSASDDIRRALQRAITTTKASPGASARAQGSDRGGDSLPLPLITLGSVALLFVLAGGAGIVRRRMRGDRPGAH